MAESYLQHAEHYYRVLRASQPAHQPAPVEHRYERFGHDPDLDDDDNNEEFEAGGDQPAREGGDQPDMEAREGRPPQPQYRDDRGPRNENRNDGPREPRAEGDDEFRRYLGAYLAAARLDPAQNRVYIDHGTATLDSFYPPYITAFDAMMAARGWAARNYVSRMFTGAEHEENAWAQRVDIPLAFLDRADP